MNWHTLAINPPALESLYRDVPALDEVELCALALGARGDLLLTFEPARFPDFPARRWPAAANRIRIELRFWGVASYAGRGWTPNAKAAVELAKTETGLTIVAANPEIDLRHEFSAEFFRIERVAAYCKPLISQFH